SFAQFPFSKLSPSFTEHSFRNIDTDNLVRIEGQGLNCEIAGSRGHVKNILRLIIAEHADSLSPPTPVDSQAQQVVKEVVPGADRVEHPGYLLLFSCRFVLVWNYRHHFPRHRGREVTTFQTD